MRISRTLWRAAMMAAVIAILAGAGRAGDSQGMIDVAKASEIALAQTGGGTVVEIDRDHEWGRIVYEIEIAGPDRHYEVEVDAHSGEVVRYREKRRGHSRRGWHHD